MGCDVMQGGLLNGRTLLGTIEHMEGLWAKIDRLTPVAQTKTERGAELPLLGIFFAPPLR